MGNKLIIGTSHFASLGYAIAYYERQGEDAKSVQAKISEGAISIGAPPEKPGSYYRMDSDGRYIEHEIITHKEYMDSSERYRLFDAGEITKEELDRRGAEIHQAYFIQFATKATFDLVRRHIGEDRIKASIDPHFNDIPLRDWDNIASRDFGVIGTINRAAKIAANEYPNSPRALYWSLSDGVFIAKACARVIKGESK